MPTYTRIVDLQHSKAVPHCLRYGVNYLLYDSLRVVSADNPLAHFKQTEKPHYALVEAGIDLDEVVLKDCITLYEVVCKALHLV